MEYPSGEKFSWEKAVEINPVIDLIYNKLDAEFTADNRIILEKKNSNISVHYRLVNDEENIRNIVNRVYTIVKENDKSRLIETFTGVKIVEIRLKGWNKGKVVEVINSRMAFSDEDLLFFLGDDITDEDGFKALRYKDIAVLVRNEQKRASYANYTANDPSEVITFLNKILDMPLKI